MARNAVPRIGPSGRRYSVNMRVGPNFTVMPKLYILLSFIFVHHLSHTVIDFNSAVECIHINAITFVERSHSIGVHPFMISQVRQLAYQYQLKRRNRNSRAVIVLLLLLSGDVELNTGPVKFPCKICRRAVAINHRAVRCDNENCHQWVYIKCGKVTPDEYENIKASASPTKTPVVWFCSGCEELNLLAGQLQQPVPTDNSFSLLSDLEDIDSDHELDPDSDSSLDLDHELDSSNGSTSHSEPDYTRKPKTAQKPRCRKLTLRSVNCRSIKSKRKQRDLRALLHQEDPDILCGTESHLDATFPTSEVFPST